MRKTPIVILALAVLANAIPDDHDRPHNDGTMNKVPTPPTHPTSSSHEHAHGAMGAPLPYINETEVLQHHAPDPLSYWAHDLGYTLGKDGVSIVLAGPDAPQSTYPMVMVLHVACMILGFFAVLPIGS